MRTLLLVFYLAVLAALLVLTLLFAVAQAVYAKSEAAPYMAIGVFALVAVLYAAEGAEIAVAALIDKDDDQVSSRIQPLLANIKKKSNSFVSGREMLVLGTLVGITLLCRALSSIPDSAVARLPHALGWLPDVAVFYVALFPVLAVLWIAQLLPKFIAQRQPIDVFGHAGSQLVIDVCAGIDWVLRLGAPSELFRDWATRRKTPQKLAPSRNEYFEASAMFRDGIALESVSVDLTIEPDGSVQVDATYSFKAYASGLCSYIEQKDFWDGPIHPKPVFKPLKSPAHCGPPNVTPAKIANAAPGSRSEVSWKLEFPIEPLNAGDEVVYQLGYKAGPNAFNCADKVPDYYTYTVEKIPVKHLQVLVRTAKWSNYSITEPKAAVNVSYQTKVNETEADRVKSHQIEQGYEFVLDHPLPLLAEYTFTWTFVITS